MRIKNESDFLNPAIRAQLIGEIESFENQARKFSAYKRYQCYKDKTKNYVVELLLRQFDYETVEEMRYALSNISIVKKVIDKLARVYSNGVERSVEDDEAATENVQKLTKLLDVNTAVKKANRFLKLHKNVDLFVKPCPVYDINNKESWAVKLEVLQPFLYDVVEDYYDRTKAMGVILSDYQPPATALYGMDGRRSPVPFANSPQNDGVDNKLADSPEDQRNYEGENREKLYVFWSKYYHLTCNSKGEIIKKKGEDKENNLNPFQVFNHINFAIDQDGSFWAEGGDDLIDGAILINTLITHTTHVGTVQGYGQFYMTGENLPRSAKIGPTKAIIAEYKKDEQAKPELGFLNANPQLDSLRGLIEMYIALYLTTNNLSTSGVSTQLQGGMSTPSGIALIIDKAESLEDIQDQRQVFLDLEPKMWEAIGAILDTYSDSVLVEELKGIKLPEDIKNTIVIKFNDATPIMSETEKLQNMKLRQDLGIDSMIGLIMKDDPTLSEKQAEDALKKLIEQKLIEKMLTKELSGEEDEQYVSENQNQEEGDSSGKSIKEKSSSEETGEEEVIQEEDESNR